MLLWGIYVAANCKTLGVRAECHIFCSILTKYRFSRQISVKVTNIKFVGHMFRGRCPDTYIRTDRLFEAVCATMRKHSQTGQHILDVRIAYFRMIL